MTAPPWGTPERPLLTSDAGADLGVLSVQASETPVPDSLVMQAPARYRRVCRPTARLRLDGPYDAIQGCAAEITSA